jgi:feruloyl-CoA synthase
MFADERENPDPATAARHDGVRAHLQKRLRAFAAASTGASMRVARIMIVPEPPSFDAGEITDKGSLNQHRVLDRWANLVAKLYAADETPDVISAEPAGTAP